MLAIFGMTFKALVTLLSVPAIAISGWMAFQHTGAAALPGCGSGSGCQAVAQSRWSRLFGLPVAGFGAVVYFLMLASWLWPNQFLPADQRNIQMALVSLAMIIVGAGIWFTLLQLLVIRRFCIYCSILHLLASLAAILVLRSAVLSFAAAVTAATALTVLVGGQILIKPTTYAFQVTGGPVTDDSTQAVFEAERGTVIEPLSVTQSIPEVKGRRTLGRQVSFLGGRITVSTADWPLLGSADATQIVGFLFDYTCDECRGLHQLLERARQYYRSRLTILVIPVPLSPLCNPDVKPRAASHPYACAYARLGLAVSAADPAKYEEYDRAVFVDGEPPPIGLARHEAQRLIAVELFDPSIPDPEIDRRLDAARKIYLSLDTQTLPALLLPRGVLQGRLADLPELLRILEGKLCSP